MQKQRKVGEPDNDQDGPGTITTDLEGIPDVSEALAKADGFQAEKRGGDLDEETEQYPVCPGCGQRHPNYGLQDIFDILAGRR